MEVISSSSPAIAQLNGVSMAVRKKDIGNDPKENLWYAIYFSFSLTIYGQKSRFPFDDMVLLLQYG